MAIINILGFVCLNCMMAYRYKEKIVTVFPVSMGIWLLTLYLLAFFQKLNYIDIICLLLIVTVSVYSVAKKIDVKDFIKNGLDSSAIMLAVILFLIWLVIQNKLAWGSDELGVWALEVKDLFYVNGFSDKYKNLAMGYGDYFPGQMLLEWWTCHFSPREFKEGLMYVGYWWIYIAFMAPVLGKLPIKRKWAIPCGICVGVLLMLVPSIVEVRGYTMIEAEMPLSAAYAGCLWSIFDPDEHAKKFLFLRLTMSMVCLMMFKETGIIFAFMALIFYTGLVYMQRKEGGIKRRAAELLGYGYGVASLFVAAIPVLIWKIYCKVYERTTYFTYLFQSTFQGISEKTYSLSELAVPLTKSFFGSLLLEPLHGEKTIGIDLTVWAVVILVGVSCFFLCKKNIMSIKEGRFIWKYYMIMLVIYMAMLLGMHIFIFQENGYVETDIMMISIARYAEPLFLGVLMFLFLNCFLIIEKTEINRELRNEIVCVCLGIILCANISAVWKQMVAYSSVNAETLADRDAVEEKGRQFIDELKNKTDMEEQGRVLWVRDTENVIYGMEWRSIAYMLAPKSLISHYINENELPKEDFYVQIWSLVKDSHCEYVFFDVTVQNPFGFNNQLLCKTEN